MIIDGNALPWFQKTKTYKVCRVQDAVLHRVGQVQGELPDSPLFGLPADSRPLLFDLRREHGQAQNFRPDSCGHNKPTIL